MSKPLNFDEAMGSKEAHLQIARNRVSNAREELDRAVNAGKPASQLDTLRQSLSEAQGQLEDLETEISQPV